MKKCFILTALMLPSLLSMASCESYSRKVPTKTLQPDSAIYAMLGRTMSDVLFHPSTVKCYTVKGKSTIGASDYQIESHWVRDSLIGELSKEIVGIIQYILISDPENYKFDSIQIKSPYYPVISFEFQKKQNIVHVMISPLDRTWTIMYDDKRQIHFNYHNHSQMDRLCEIFLPTTNEDKQ